MPAPRLALAAAVVAAGLLGACSDPGHNTSPDVSALSSYASPRAMAERLAASGVECTAYRDLDLAERSLTAIGLEETRRAVGTCQSGGVEVDLTTFARSKDATTYLEDGKAGCGIARAFGGADVPVAVGADWSVEAARDAAWHVQAAKALGGATLTLHC